MNFYPGQGKLREFSGWSGRFWIGLEMSGKLKLNSCGRPQEIYLFCSRVEYVLFRKLVQAEIPYLWGLLLDERICYSKKEFVLFK